MTREAEPKPDAQPAVPRLPFLWNPHVSNFGVLFLVLGALFAQAHPAIDYGEAEWGLIMLVARELLAIASRITGYYTARGAQLADDV